MRWASGDSRSCAGHMLNQLSRTPLISAPRAMMQYLCTELLSEQDVLAARLACRAWATGIATALAPREASVVIDSEQRDRQRGLVTRALLESAGPGQQPPAALPALAALHVRLPLEPPPSPAEVRVLCGRLGGTSCPALASVSVHLDCSGAFLNLQQLNTAQVGAGSAAAALAPLLPWRCAYQRRPCTTTTTTATATAPAGAGPAHCAQRPGLGCVSRAGAAARQPGLPDSHQRHLAASGRLSEAAAGALHRAALAQAGRRLWRHLRAGGLRGRAAQPDVAPRGRRARGHTEPSAGPSSPQLRPCSGPCWSVTCGPWRQHAVLHQSRHLTPLGGPAAACAGAGGHGSAQRAAPGG